MDEEALFTETPEVNIKQANVYVLNSLLVKESLFLKFI